MEKLVMDEKPVIDIPAFDMYNMELNYFRSIATAFTQNAT
jgi:hypothetical protein